MIALFECLGIGPSSSAYVSTPITTGRAFLDWITSSDSNPALYQSEVYDRNVVAAKELVASARKRFVGAVIDPTALPKIAGWEQPDYHAFWVEVVERYVHTIVFANGWQFSTGAVLEFAAAINAGARTIDARFTPIVIAEAIDEIADAQAAFAKAGFDSTPLRDALGRVKDATGPENKRMVPNAQR